MSNIKLTLCLLAIVATYGIAGRLDHDDAVMPEEIEHQSAGVVADDCLRAEGREAQALHRPRELRDSDRPLPLDATRSDVAALLRPCPDTHR